MERLWTTKPADFILRPCRFGTGCFVRVAGFTWAAPRMGQPILAARPRFLIADEPHNHEVDGAIATRKGTGEEIGRSRFVETRDANEARTGAQPASLKRAAHAG